MSAVVAFDLDGTLVDSTRDLADALSRALVDEGALPAATLLAPDVVRPWIGHGARALCAAAAAALAPALDVDALLARFRARYGEALCVHTHPYAGIVEACRALRADGLALAIATNKPGVFARPLVATLLPDVFAAVRGPDDVGSAKPDPALLLAAAAAAGGRLAAYVGDSAVDQRAAQRAGVPFVGVGWGLGALTGPDVVDDAAALVDAVRAIVAEPQAWTAMRRT